MELRQPSFLEGRTTGFVRGEYNAFPVLYPLPEGVNPEDEPIIGYHQVLASTGVERAFFGQHLTVIPSYNWQANFPFSYQKTLQPGLEPIRVSFPELFMALDFRDDPIRTTRGVYISNELQVAGYLFQGTVNDVRIKPEVRVYTRGALGKNSVFAARATVGFLFPGNYGQTLNPTPEQLADPNYGPENELVVRDQQKLLMRAFYSGGPSSNRGYPYRSVGPHGPIGFLVPSNVSSNDCRLQGRSVEELPQGCIRPLGGLSLWELSLETRVPISDVLGGRALRGRERSHDRYGRPARQRAAHLAGLRLALHHAGGTFACGCRLSAPVPPTPRAKGPRRGRRLAG